MCSGFSGLDRFGWIVHPGSGAGSQEPGYTLDYQLNIPSSANFNGGSIPYATNNSGSIVTGSFDRVAYELTLSGSTISGSPNGNIWASFDRQSADASKLGVPADFTGEVYGGSSVVQFVNNMNVITSPGFSSLAGTGITNGNIQFWSTNYSPNPSTNLFDWADNGGGTSGPNYGSMQISEVNPANHAQGQMLISYNNWGSDGGKSDLRLGNNTVNSNGINPNYTFRGNAGDYTAPFDGMGSSSPRAGLARPPRPWRALVARPSSPSLSLFNIS